MDGELHKNDLSAASFVREKLLSAREKRHVRMLSNNHYSPVSAIPVVEEKPKEKDEDVVSLSNSSGDEHSLAIGKSFPTEQAIGEERVHANDSTSMIEAPLPLKSQTLHQPRMNNIQVNLWT